MDFWREILLEAIAASPTQPMRGTTFRQAVDLSASKRDLKFPPADEPQLRFIQLVERYPDVVSLRRQPGQDFLVAPSGRSDLLAKGIQQRLYGVRRDLFEAFSRVSERRPYYDKATEVVVWDQPEEGKILPGSWIPIEPAQESAEVKLRQDFAETVRDLPARSQLSDALGQTNPFQNFGRVVREMGLQRDWHSFRTERLVEKVQKWARDNKIEWKESWLTDQPDYTTKGRSGMGRVLTDTDRSPLELLFSGLDKADIQRISIPLDLVLKAISSSKKN